MLCVRARPLFSSSSPISLAISKTKHSPTTSLHFRHFRTRSLTTTMSSTSPPQLIEHIVLFKVKPSTPQTKITTMMNNLNSLSSLPQLLHISASPLHRSVSSFDFTHVLHSRYGSKQDLESYASHPDHVRVVKENVLPICDDVMAVDWVADEIPTMVAPLSGCVGRVSFIKVKENVLDEGKMGILDVIKGLREKLLLGVNGENEMTVGENFSPGRAKGYSIASVVFFKDLGEMEAVDGEKEVVELEKGKVRDLIESTIVVEFVVPSSTLVSGL